MNVLYSQCIILQYDPGLAYRKWNT